MSGSNADRAARPADSVPSPPVYVAAGVAIVVAFYVGVPVWAIWLARRRLRRFRRHAAAVAAEAGLDVDLTIRTPRSLGFDLTNPNRGATAHFLMRRPGTPDAVFRLQYKRHPWTDRSSTFYFTCVLLPMLPFHAPHLTIGPEGFWSGVGRVVGARDIEVESPQFNRRYRVRCDDERFAVTLLSHEMLAWMLRESDRGRTIRFEVVGGRLLWVADGLPIAQQPQLLREAADIRSHLPKVLSELYPP